MTMFTRKPSEVRSDVIDCMQAGLVPFITSSPGLGKSSIVAQIAADFDLTLIDIRLSQCAPEDLMGLPMKDVDGDKPRSKFVPFGMFPLDGDKVPGNGWILFLDEFNSASKSVQSAAYKIILDRMVGQEKLHPNCFVVAAGNLASDRAIVNQLSTAMQSRLIHIEMVTDHKDFMTFAHKAKFDHRILGFLEFRPEKLQQFDPDHNDRTFACPRTWEFASRLIKDKDFSQIKLSLLAGTLSEGVAIELHTFMQEYDKLPSFTSILNAPEKIDVPREASTRYALVSMLLDRFSADTFPSIVKYVRRLSPEFQVIYFRGAERKNPKIVRERSFQENIQHLAKFLVDETEEKQFA